MANFYLAPLRGITDGIFRRAYERCFGRFDHIVSPFIPIVLGNQIKDHHIRDILSDKGGSRMIPQIIGREPDGFLLLSRKFADLGFTSVNWNLGCPAPLVAKKTRGCGLLPHIDVIKQFLDEVTPKLPLPLSIKARLGYESPSDLEALIPIFNNYPMKELIIHPRIGTQLYDGTVDLDRFETCLNMSKHPVVYNGDIISVDKFKQLSDRFPNVDGWMIGRGIVRNPFLLDELRKYADGTISTGHTLSPEEISQIKSFLNDLVNACKDNTHPINILGRMKEIWKYLGSGIDGWEDLSKKVLKCASLQEYLTLMESIG
jgi:tRNA-dihydrouridine synthase B